MKCYCGNDIVVARRDYNYLLSETEQYCSIDCFFNSLTSTQKSPVGNAILKRSDIATPYDSWSSLLRRFYRSLFEVKFAEILYLRGITFLYEPFTLELTNNKKYTPDFYLPDYRLFVELKGVWTGSGKKKLRMAMYDGVNIRLIPYYLSDSINAMHTQLNINTGTKRSLV